MTVIVRVPAQIGVVYPENAEVHDMVAAVAIAAGQPVYQNSSGRAALSDANGSGTTTFRGIALKSVGAGQGVSILKRGHVYGFTLSQAYDAEVFVSDTVGELDDAAGTTSIHAGRVMALPDSSATKVLYIEATW